MRLKIPATTSAENISLDGFMSVKEAATRTGKGIAIFHYSFTRREAGQDLDPWWDRIQFLSIGKHVFVRIRSESKNSPCDG